MYLQGCQYLLEEIHQSKYHSPPDRPYADQSNTTSDWHMMIRDQPHIRYFLVRTDQSRKSRFETNLASVRAENAQASLDEMKELRANVSQQIVMNAARGTASGAGSAEASINNVESIVANDDKTRRMNLLVKENQLRAADVLSGLHTLTSETKLGQSLTNQIFNNLPISRFTHRINRHSSW